MDEWLVVDAWVVDGGWMVVDGWVVGGGWMGDG